MNPLLALEMDVLAEGREWTRQRLQERLQAEADAIGEVCPDSGLLLKDVRQRPITLHSCVGLVTVMAAYGFSKQTGRWLSPAREHWHLEPWQRITPELEQRVNYSATHTGSYEKAAAMATRRGSPVSDDLVHKHVQRIGERAQERPLPQPEPAPAPERELPFSLVIMMDGWMVRERGPDWAMPPEAPAPERVAWHEVKSAVIYRLDHRAETATGRGVLTQKKVVACPPGTDPLEFGASVQAQALHCGLARAQYTLVIADGAVWLWRLIEDRFSGATALLDFYHASEHLWELAHHLYPDDAQAARISSSRCCTSCAMETGRTSSRGSRNCWKNQTENPPIPRCNAPSITSSITVTISIIRMSPTAAAPWVPVPSNPNAASSRTASSAQASSGVAPAWPTSSLSMSPSETTPSTNSGTDLFQQIKDAPGSDGSDSRADARVSLRRQLWPGLNDCAAQLPNFLLPRYQPGFKACQCGDSLPPDNILARCALETCSTGGNSRANMRSRLEVRASRRPEPDAAREASNDPSQNTQSCSTDNPQLRWRG
jgi:hypothetical protein